MHSADIYDHTYLSGLPNNATVEMEELSAEEMEVAAKREVSCS